MYHYRESGLPNVYLKDGYREVQTAYGPSVVIEDVEGLHRAVAMMLVSERPHLTGPELRFIRRYLEKTQAELACLLGVEEQSVRRWEKLARVPKPADRALRLLFLNGLRDEPAQVPDFGDLVERTLSNDETHRQVSLRFRPRAKEPWQREELEAA